MCMAEQCIFLAPHTIFCWCTSACLWFYASALQSSVSFIFTSLFLVVVRIVSLTFTFGDTFSFGIHLTFSGLLFCSLFSSSFNFQYFCVCVPPPHFQIHASLSSSFFRFASLLHITSPSYLWLSPTSILLHTFVHILLCIPGPLSPSPPSFSLTYNPSSLVIIHVPLSRSLPLSLHLIQHHPHSPLTHTHTHTHKQNGE